MHRTTHHRLSLFLLSCVFASEERHVVTIDIEGAYMHGIMKNDVYMKIDGKCVDVLMHNYENIYDGYVSHNRLYVRLSRALYGTIDAAKIWYDTISSKL